jgi:hypothetical protein
VLSVFIAPEFRVFLDLPGVRNSFFEYFPGMKFDFVRGSGLGLSERLWVH